MATFWSKNFSKLRIAIKYVHDQFVLKSNLHVSLYSLAVFVNIFFFYYRIFFIKKNTSYL